eukprot:GHVU01078895.1.p6 GENE.GHVU01078895.1~~GHVU01078895.1.p6  ORF type:complete len:110 (+),score=11.60 GHVU01078895.1:959-1288(+)
MMAPETEGDLEHINLLCFDHAYELKEGRIPFPFLDHGGASPDSYVNYIRLFISLTLSLSPPLPLPMSSRVTHIPPAQQRGFAAAAACRYSYGFAGHWYCWLEPSSMYSR